MKKILSIAAAALALAVTSCSNEAVPVSQTTTFKLNLNTVMEPFTYEFVAGELETISSKFKIRARLLIYDEDGNLAYKKEELFSNYGQQMTDVPSLKEGTYTVLALSDVINPDNNGKLFEYWSMTGEDNIETCRLTNTGYIGYKNEIIGYATTYYTVGMGSDQLTLDLKPAGAIFATYQKNIHTYSDVVRIQLGTNRSADYIQFNKNGSYDLAVKSNNNKFDWRVSTINVADFTSANVYAYNFVLPFSNISFQWELYDSNNTGVHTQPVVLRQVEPGHEYLFILDLYNDEGKISQSYGDITGMTRSSKTDLLEAIPAEAVSAIPEGPAQLKVKDLVK